MSCLLFKFKRLQYGLLHPVSCTDRVIHAFPKNRHEGPPGPEIFSSACALTAHHTLWARCCYLYIRNTDMQRMEFQAQPP